MDAKKDIILNNYLNNVYELYKNIKVWLKEKNLLFKEQDIEIYEENSGKYHVSKLLVTDEKNNQIAEILPVGAWTIGADGRIDLTGKFDQQILIYLKNNSNHLSTASANKENGELKNNYSLYKGVDQDGWYWIEYTRFGKAHVLNKGLFFDLLSEISDHEF
ncbi:Uncharacterized protein dnl_03190 [Desulfonema limicola]|uniref:Uncharacterized protein n=1 Tax=Desulfonema limicola TaxID=45656 RepID=A0A975B3H5_9BACT|nr:hypothetical protein [Desulfonema limicola]QTA78107.1 Uncharacterized protein dnl_03190 [Desulfonema limicola]